MRIGKGSNDENFRQKHAGKQERYLPNVEVCFESVEPSENN